MAHHVNNPAFNLKRHSFPSNKPVFIQEAEQHFYPNPGTDLNKDVAITFEIITPSYKFLHALDQPFFMEFEVKNQATETTLEGIIPAQKQTRVVDDLVYMPSAIGAGCLFDSASIEINGVKILEKNAYIGNNDYLYTSLNKFFSTHKDRINQIGRDTMIENSLNLDLGHQTGKTDYKTAFNAKLESELTSMDMKSKGAVESQISTFGFDSIPFLGFSNNCLNKIRGDLHSNDHGHAILPPGTKLTIKLFKSNPLYKKLIWNFKEDYFVKSSQQSPQATDTTDKIKKLRINIKSLYFRMRSYVSPKQSFIANELSHKNLCYSIDLVQEMDSTLLSNTKHTTNMFNIRRNTKLVYLFFMREHCLWPSDSKTPLPAWFTFPEYIENCQIKINDGLNLISSEGLSNIGGNEGNTSATAYAYYTYLKSRGFVDSTFESFFPRDGYSIKQAIVLDLSNQDLPELPTLKVDITWKNNSPQKYSIVLFTVGTGTLEIKPNHHVTVTHD